MIIGELIPRYLRHLKTLGRSPHTIKGAKYGLYDFVEFLNQETVHRLEDLTTHVLYEYQQDLAFRPTQKGKLLSLRTQAHILTSVKGFTRFLKDQGYLFADPGAAVKLPKKPKTLPRVILSEVEIKQLTAACDLRTHRGFRNRVILEILYDTAIRRAELARIKTNDLDLAAGFVRVCGKGDKERVAPVSQRVCGLIDTYIALVRPVFLKGRDSGHLILNRWGEKMHPNSVWAVVKRCARLSGIKKPVTTHSFRHTCATHMLQNGAPIRHLQEMLGHASLESTQIYTRVTITDLKAAHSKYHPSERRDAIRKK